MKNNHRSKLSYYKQIYNFSSLVAQFAHPSWLEDLQIPAKIAKDKKNVLAFQSQMLLQNAPSFDKSNLTEFGILLFISSLPKPKFNRILNYLVLAFLKNDKSLLINGLKLKKLGEYFNADEMDFLTHEKEVKIKLDEKVTLDKSIVLDEYFLLETAFTILNKIIGQKNVAILKRVQFRFPKNLSEQKTFYFTQNIDSNINMSVLSLMAQALYPEIYSVLEAEGLAQ